MAVFWLDILYRALWSSVTTIGQSFGGLLYAVAVGLIAALWLYKQQGWAAMKSHLLTTIGKFLTVAVVAWLPFFLVSIPYHLYDVWRDANGKFEQEKQAHEADTNIWEQEKKKLTTELENKKPRFDAFILQTFLIQNADNDVTDIYLLVTVRNVGGSPSTLDSFRLTMTTHDTLKEPLQTLPAIISKQTYSDKQGKPMYRFQKKDWLVEKLLQPIQPGSTQIGYLRFIILDLKTINDVDQLTLTFRDIMGQNWTATYKSTGRSSPPFYYPGVDPPMIDKK